ncbi:MAG: malto-oligosyltrehalose synthase [Anaerolineae bacterium]
MTTHTTPINFDNLLDAIFQDRRIPHSTYRVQFGPHFTFNDAQNLIDYLHTLGISDLYTSPLYQPREGSTHGYDTVDYNRFNPALGNEDEFNALVDTLHAHQMSLLLDIVPNHMGIGKDNPWWMDVLKHGPSSVYSHYFDINWQPENRALDNKVLLPVLGDHYGRELENGRLKLVYWHGDFYLHYWENQYPITPDTYANILREAHHSLVQEPFDQWVEDELLSILTALQHIPPFQTRDKSLLVEMRREQKIARQRFVHLYDHSDQFRGALDSALERINGVQGMPETFDILDDILENQPYRLSFWRAASDEINYRRFFDINDMAAIRIEHPEVFQKTHQLTFNLLGEGKISGLRIDHPDGLWNPKLYFLQLQEEYIVARLRQDLPEEAIDRTRIRERLIAQGQADQATNWPLYVLAEKILSETEPLPYDWAVYGTTGYDFMIAVTSLFVDSTNQDAFDTLYHEFVGEPIDFDEIVDVSKKYIMTDTLNSELYARSAQLAEIVEQNRRYRGFTRHTLEHALIEITAALAIYRTYITADEPVSERDRTYINQAVEIAKKRNPRSPAYMFDFVRDMLQMKLFEAFDKALHEDMREFVMQYQQMSGPVMAKSVEDTSFYIYNRLTSLNEVGGHPEQFGISVDEFHAHNRNKGYRQTMLSTSTHDTKRSEDVRARISVLSEIPDEWYGAITRWSGVSQALKVLVEGAHAPSPNDEYLLYQTLIGAYPLHNDPDFEMRIVGYMRKAINEAKVHSNWVNANDAYHQAMADLIHHLLNSETFMADFLPFQERVSYYGFLNSLATTLLKITSPGVPDIYQGNEMWNYSLVDPDNRRPVDYDLRGHLLENLLNRAQVDRPALATDLIQTPEDGQIKLYLTALSLRFRGEHERLFTEGDYMPLTVSGERAQHLCAYLRATDDDVALIAVPRLVVQLTDGQTVMPCGVDIWRETVIHLPLAYQVPYQDVLTGDTHAAAEQIRVADLFGKFPVALLSASTDTSA